MRTGRGAPRPCRAQAEGSAGGVWLYLVWLRWDHAGWTLSAVLKQRPRREVGTPAAGLHTPNPRTALLLPRSARRWQPALHRNGLRARRREGGGGGSSFKSLLSLGAGPTSTLESPFLG